MLAPAPARIHCAFGGILIAFAVAAMILPGGAQVAEVVADVRAGRRTRARAVAITLAIAISGFR